MEANTKIIYQRLQGIEDELVKLNNTIYALKSTDIRQYRTNYEELSVNAALRAERIACRMRNLVMRLLLVCQIKAPVLCRDRSAPVWPGW